MKATTLSFLDETEAIKGFAANRQVAG